MCDLQTILTEVTKIAARVREEFLLGSDPITSNTPVSELGFESLHLVELMLSLSEAFGEEAIENLEIDPQLSLHGLAQQIKGQLMNRNVGQDHE